MVNDSDVIGTAVCCVWGGRVAGVCRCKGWKFDEREDKILVNLVI